MEDLEKSAQDSEEEGIQLPEDKVLGKVIFYVQHTDWVAQFIFLYGYFMTLGVCIFQLYIEKLISLLLAFGIFLSPLFFLVYCEFFAVFSSGRILVLKVVLEQLLKDIECTNPKITAIDWRRIAYSANQMSRQLGRQRPIFYGKDHCIRYFREQLVDPVEKGTYCIKTLVANEEREFFHQQSSRDLALKAVKNYKLGLQMNVEVSNANSRLDQPLD